MNRALVKFVRRYRREDFWGKALPQKNTVLAEVNTEKMLPTDIFEEFDEKLQYHEAEARLYKVIHNFPNIEPKQFSPLTNFKELGLDSLAQINLITAIEIEFNTLFSEEVFDNFESCNDILKFMCSNKRAF